MVAHLQQSKIYPAYEEAFQATTGLPLALRPIGAQQSPLQGATHANPFCALMAHETGLRRAFSASSRRSKPRPPGQGPKPWNALPAWSNPLCNAVGENIVAYLQTGQVMLRRPSPAQFRRVWKELAAGGSAVPREALEKAYFASHLMARPHYESVLRLLAIFAEQLSALSNQIMVQHAAAKLPPWPRPAPSSRRIKPRRSAWGWWPGRPP